MLFHMRDAVGLHYLFSFEGSWTHQMDGLS